MDKDYGKYTPDQLKTLAEQLPELLSLAVGQVERFKEQPQKLREILGRGYAWAAIYELPLVQQIALLFIGLGLQDKLHVVASATDAVKTTMDMWADDGEMDHWYSKHEAEIDPAAFIVMATVLHRNAHSIMLNQCSLDVLAAKVRQGDDQAFREAVRVDRSILACPPFADRLARAELENDTNFFNNLANDLKGPRANQGMTDKQLNYLMAVLQEAGITSMSEDQMERLFVRYLELVVPGPDEDAVPNLVRRFQRIRKKSTT